MTKLKISAVALILSAFAAAPAPATATETELLILVTPRIKAPKQSGQDKVEIRGFGTFAVTGRKSSAKHLTRTRSLRLKRKIRTRH